MGKEALEITFPHSAVLYLRCHANTPDIMYICIKTPGGDISYPVEVLKMTQYSLDEIKEKKLLFLVPFFIFCYEDQLAKLEQDVKLREKLIQQYQVIYNWLEELCKQQKIDEFIRYTILEMSQKVVNAVTRKYAQVKEGVNQVMGGKVLDYEASDILNRGIEQGIEQVMKVLIENCKEFHCSKSDTVKRVSEKFSLSENRAEELVSKYW